jgi:hypothetical protein
MIKPNKPNGDLLAATYLVDHKIQTALENANLDSICLFKPGDSLAISVNVQGGPAGIAEQSRQKLEASCKASNITISPQSPIKMTISSVPGPVKQLIVIGPADANNNKVSYYTVKHSIVLSKDGKPLSESNWSFDGPSSSIERKPSETYQQAVDRMVNDSYKRIGTPPLLVPIFKDIKTTPPPKSPMLP